MAKQKTNEIGLQAGDIISFTNKVGFKKVIQVSRVEEKSWYCGKSSRNSFGTLEGYMKYPDFKIEKAGSKS